MKNYRLFLFLVNGMLAVSITMSGCMDKITTKPPISNPKPLSNPSPLGNELINRMKRGLLVDEAEKTKVIDFLKQLNAGDKKTIQKINDNLIDRFGPVLLVIVSAEVFANEDDEVQMVRFLGSIKDIDPNLEGKLGLIALGEAIKDAKVKLVSALLDIGASKTKSLDFTYTVVLSDGVDVGDPTPLAYAEHLKSDTKIKDKEDKYDAIIALLK